MNDNGIKDIQNRRMRVFRELVELLWNNEGKFSLEVLGDRMVKEGIFREHEKNIFKSYLRISMGLDPKSVMEEFSDELDAAMNLERVSKPIVTVLEDVCDICRREGKVKECNVKCEHGASAHIEKRGIIINNDKCLTCGDCIPDCPLDAVVDKIEFVPVIKHLKNQKVPVYAAIAPAYIGQFGEGVKPGQIRSALKHMGFMDLVEVALFADLLTLREVYEFDHIVKKHGDYLITSCCCPIWMSMVQKGYPELLEHFSPAVSPMIAAGRALKSIYKDCIVVFIGPCIAKKNEAKDKELAGAIDYVLTFKELDEVFKALKIRLQDQEDDHKEQSSCGGRIYARTGGVSRSVESALESAGFKDVDFRPIQANGVKECKAVLDKLKLGAVEENFIEGMGCAGGCVGGPRSILDIEKAVDLVNEYGDSAKYRNALDNARVAIVLEKLNISSIKDVLGEQAAELLGREV
ncbi:MAG: [Fe-Fe] hydrogenase large subunit C-terminal domain-containing protein [Bacillota bacterium]